MKKVLSILLTIAMICQCLTFVTFSADEDVVEATKTTLIETVKDGTWSKDNAFKFLKGDVMKAPDGSTQGNAGGGWLHYMMADGSRYKTENGVSWYEYSGGSSPHTYVWNDSAVVDGKLTAEITYYDDSAVTRTGLGYILSIFGEYSDGGTSGDKVYPVIKITKDGPQILSNNIGGDTETKIGGKDTWIDLKVEWLIQPDGIYRNSWWKENGTSDWTALEENAGPITKNDAVTKLTKITGINLFDPGANAGKLRVSNLSLVHTARPEVEATTATDDMAPETESFTVTFDQTMADGQTAIKLLEDGEEIGARVLTADNRTYTIEADLEGNAVYTVDVTGMKSAEGLYVLDTQNFTFTTTTAAGDTGAVKTTLIETVKDGTWSKNNSFKFMKNGNMTAADSTGTNGGILWQMRNDSAYVNDSNRPYYETQGNVVHPYAWDSSVTVDGKLTAELTYYDDSTVTRSGAGLLLSIYGTEVSNDKTFQVAYLKADGTQKHVGINGYETETVIGAVNNWVDLKVEWLIQPDGIYRNSWWKLDSSSDWNVLETNAGPLTNASGTKLLNPTGINMFLASNGSGGKLRVSDMSLVHTSRAAVEESSIEDGADDVDKNVNFTITFDQIMSTAQAEGAVKFVAGEEVINAILETEDYKTYTVSAALNGGTEYTVDVTGMKSAEGLYVLDTNNFAFTTVADAPEEDENLTGATKTVLIETSKEGTWSKDNSFKVMQDGELKAPGAGQWSWSPVLYTMGGKEEANFVNDSAKPYYFATGAEPYLLNFSKMGTTVDGKLTAEISYYDDSSATRDGAAYIMAIYGVEASNDKTFQVVQIDKDRTQKHIDTRGYATTTTFDATDKWVDLKIEWLIQPDGVYRNSWWKLDSSNDWNVLETNAGPISTASGTKLLTPTGINLFLANNGGSGGKLRVSDMSLVHTSRAVVAESSIADGANDVDSLTTKSFTVTFDQLMESGAAANAIKVLNGTNLVASTFATEDNKTYTVTLTDNLEESTSYTVEFPGLKSAEGLAVTDSMSFTTKAGVNIKATAANAGLVDWKKSNDFVINFSSAVDPVTVTADAVTITYADGKATDVPFEIKSVSASSVTLRIGQLEPWKNYKINFADTIKPASTQQEFNGAVVKFTSAHADILEADYNMEGSINGLVSGFTGGDGLPTAEATETDEETGLKFNEWKNECPDGSTYRNLNPYITPKNETKASALMFEYIIRADADSMRGTNLALFNWQEATAAINATASAYTINGTAVTNDNKFKQIKVNYSLEANDTRKSTAFLMGENGWENVGGTKVVTNGTAAVQPSTESPYVLMKQTAYPGQPVGPIDYARVIVSTVPQADILSVNEDFANDKITLNFGKNLDAATVIKVKQGEASVDATATRIDANTYEIKFEEILDTNAQYTVDLSGVVAADGVLGAADYTFTTPKADIEASGGVINDDLTTSISIENTTSAPVTVTVFLALYDEKGAMVKLDSEEKTLDPGTWPCTDVAITDKQPAKGYTAKLFVWKGSIDDVVPAAEAVEKTF